MAARLLIRLRHPLMGRAAHAIESWLREAHRMRMAGGSARREYERRRAREAARRAATRKLRIAVTLATPVVVYLAVRLGLPWLVNSLFESTAASMEVDGPRTDPIDAQAANLAGLLAAAGATIRVVDQLWGRRQTTEAWGKGADGEERTGRLLSRLPSSFVVRHDLPMPRSRANIDHVVVGPTGVFTVETKSYSGGITISGSRVTSSKRIRNGIVEQAQRQAAAIAARTGCTVRPVVVVHGGVRLGWFSSPVVDGVRFCPPGKLTKVLSSGPTLLDGVSVAELTSRL